MVEFYVVMILSRSLTSSHRVQHTRPETLAAKVSFYHPNVDESFAKMEAISNHHPRVQGMLRAYLPSTHVDVDAVLRLPSDYALPIWHPK